MNGLHAHFTCAQPSTIMDMSVLCRPQNIRLVEEKFTTVDIFAGDGHFKCFGEGGIHKGRM